MLWVIQLFFKTKFVNFSDGRIMHLSLQGCNNDAEGRNNDDWQANIYTKTEFMMWAEHFKRDSEPYKKSGAFELKQVVVFVAYMTMEHIF